MRKIMRRYRPKRLRVLWRRHANIDNTLDLSVDLGLVFLDAFSTPILIPIRIGKVFLKKGIKVAIKKAKARVSA